MDNEGGFVRVSKVSNQGINGNEEVESVTGKKTSSWLYESMVKLSFSGRKI